MDDLESIARVICHASDKDQIIVRCDGLFANAHRSKIRRIMILFLLPILFVTFLIFRRITL
jgi:hypothetical protein